MSVITTNRKAWHDYFVLDTYETGIVLTGAEVKSLRAAKVNLQDSFCVFLNGEIYLRNAQITPYDKGSFFNAEATRDRKLLMHSKEIQKLKSKSSEKGLSVVPLKLYFKQALIKVEIALCQGKKNYDKRETLKQRDVEREIQRARKNF